jgi:hypothetical protein
MTFPPRFERVVSALGDLARPAVLYLAALSSAIATVAIVFLGLDLTAGALFIGTAWGGVAVLYGAKAAEVAAIKRRDAEIEIARAQSPQSDQGV